MKPIIMSIFCLFLACSSGNNATIIFDNAPLMEKPSSKSKQIGILKKNTKVSLISIDKQGENFDENYYNYWKQIKLETGKTGWVFGYYFATIEEQNIIEIANNHLKSLTEKDGLRGDYKDYRYTGIFFENNVWRVEYNYKTSKEFVLGACNSLHIEISKNKKVAKVSCLS